MRRPAISVVQGEEDLHIQVADFLRWAWPAHLPWFHVPNGGSRAKVTRTDPRTGRKYSFSPEAAKLKRMGVRPGVGDLCFLLPRFTGFIELKVGANTQEPDQVQFQADVVPLGHGYQVCRSLEDVIAVLSVWLKPHGLQLRIQAPQPTFALTSPRSPRSAA